MEELEGTVVQIWEAKRLAAWSDVPAWMAVDPRNANHLVASYNDYRRGDGTCGVSYSLDGGKSWADSTTPNGFTRGTAFGAVREYWQAGGDTSVAWDSKGNAYLSCQVFNRGAGTSPNPDQSSAFYVYRSTATNGASFNFTGHPAAENNDVAGSGAALLDKQLLTVDNQPRQPVPGPRLRHLDKLRRGRHRLHL